MENTRGAKEKDDRENIDAVPQISVAANRGLYDRIQEDKDMCEALRELMKDQIEQEKKQEREQGIEQGEKRSTLNAIRKMMEKMKLTAQQAMDVLDIAAEDRKNYIAML